MFTGIVEEVGTIKSIIKGARSARLGISASKVLEDVHIGDSISTNGVCLTVTDFEKGSFSVDVMPETMNRSSLKELRIGDAVNLERAMSANGRFGGHIVSGHIDGTGIIKSFQEDENAVWIHIGAEENIIRYIVEKGSVAIDGVSLTVALVSKDYFSLSIIPHTRNETALLKKGTGSLVNIECDVVGKYIERFLHLGEKSPKKDISMDFLMEHGFIKE